MATFSTRNIGGLRGRGQAPQRGCAMSATKDETFTGIGKRLRGQDEDITHEPLPRRWVDLIRYLDEQERKRLAPRQTTTGDASRRRNQNN